MDDKNVSSQILDSIFIIVVVFLVILFVRM